MSINNEIAAIFNSIADVLEIQDGNTFRIRAYRNAVRTLENLDEPINELIDHQEKIAGIGSTLSDKIKEYCTTGKMAAYDKMLAEVPAGLFDMLKIASFGPKRVKLVYQSLAIDSVEKLEKAAAAGQIQNLPGMGAKSEAKILKNIRDFRTLQTARIFWPKADLIVKRYTDYLSKIKTIDKLEIAGSYRRRRESVGDLDILVTTKADPLPIIKAFVEYPEVIEILAQGATKASVVLAEKIQVDFRVVKPASFGAALQYFTGSKEHNVAVRKIAKSKGLKLSEYGVFRGDDCIASETEEEIYNVLGLEYVPAEIRENRGEIEQAANGQLPRLIQASDIKGVLHMHSTDSDGHATISEMAQAGIAAGYEYIAITDHSRTLSIANGLSTERLLAQLAEIKKIRLELPQIKILTGIESEILLDGSLDYSDQILGQLDFVVAAIHSSFDLSQEDMTARIVKALSNPYVSCFAHPTGRKPGIRLPYKVNPEILIETALEKNVILEINASPERMDLNDTLARKAREAGVLLVINTDAHSSEQLPRLDYGINIARRAGCQAEDIINTWSFEKLQMQIKKTRQ